MCNPTAAHHTAAPHHSNYVGPKITVSTARWFVRVIQRLRVMGQLTKNHQQPMTKHKVTHSYFLWWVQMMFVSAGTQDTSLLSSTIQDAMYPIVAI